MGKTMSIVMKKKLTTTALAIATIMGMGYSAAASADSTTFTTTINVHSDNTCELEVVQPGDATFQATWTKTPGVDASTLTVDSAKDPVFIKVNVSDAYTGPTCQLNNVKIGTDVQGTAVAAESSGDASAAWLQAFGTGGGQWRFAPSLAQLKLYTTNDYDAGSIVPVADISVKDALGNTHVQQANAKAVGGADITAAALPAMGSQETSYTLTDGFFNTAGGFVPMAAQGGNALTYILGGTSSTAAIKSMEVGVGGIIGGDPEDGSQGVDRGAAAEGDTATLSWITTVSLA